MMDVGVGAFQSNESTKMIQDDPRWSKMYQVSSRFILPETRYCLKAKRTKDSDGYFPIWATLHPLGAPILQPILPWRIPCIGSIVPELPMFQCPWWQKPWFLVAKNRQPLLIWDTTIIDTVGICWLVFFLHQLEHKLYGGLLCVVLGAKCLERCAPLGTSSFAHSRLRRITSQCGPAIWRRSARAKVELWALESVQLKFAPSQKKKLVLHPKQS